MSFREGLLLPLSPGRWVHLRRESGLPQRGAGKTRSPVVPVFPGSEVDAWQVQAVRRWGGERAELLATLGPAKAASSWEKLEQNLRLDPAGAGFGRQLRTQRPDELLDEGWSAGLSRRPGKPLPGPPGAQGHPCSVRPAPSQPAVPGWGAVREAAWGSVWREQCVQDMHKCLLVTMWRVGASGSPGLS